MSAARSTAVSSPAVVSIKGLPYRAGIEDTPTGDVSRHTLITRICGFGVTACCAGTNWWNLGLGAAPCTIALGALCSLAVAALPDARALCSAANDPTGWSVC